MYRCGNFESNLMTREGSRPLYPHKEDDGNYYGYNSREDFLKKLQRIKQRTQRQVLTMLDIGGNIGRALNDAKEIDPTLTTANMTLVNSLIIDGDVVIRRPAEYMPAVFEESFDLIESNVAFTYFLFPDIALKNAIKALFVGGGELI